MKKKFWLAAAPLLLLIPGCSDRDLAAVRNFSAQSQESQEVFAAIAQDFYGSCIRQARHNNLRQDIGRGQAATPTATTPTAATEEETDTLLEQLLASANQPTPTRQSPLEPSQQPERIAPLSIRRQAQEERCRERWSDTKKQMMELQGVMLSYTQALGELASGDLTDYSGEFANLQASIDNLNTALQATATPGTTAGFDGEAASGAVSIVEFLTTLVAQRYQKDKLVETITETDPAFQDFVGGLVSLIENDYMSVLDRERLNLRQYYQVTIERQLARLGNDSPNQASEIPLLAILVDDRWRAEVAELDNRQQIAQLYVEVLQANAQAHHELVAILNDRPLTPETVTEVKAMLLQQSERVNVLLKQAEEYQKQLPQSIAE